MRRSIHGALCSVLRLGVFVLRRMPSVVVYAFCDGAASVVYLMDGKRRRRGLRHVAVAFPECTASEHRRVIRGVYRHLARLAYEITVMDRKLRLDNLHECVQMEGAEHIRPFMDSGTDPAGAIFVTGHVGNWEVLGAAMSLLFGPLTSVARSVEDDAFARYLRELREVHGQKIISFRGAVQKGRKLAAAGERLAFVADQHARVSRIWIPFLGAPAAWIKTPASLARRFGLPLAIMFCRRIGPGFRFAVAIHPLVYPDPTLSARADVARMTLIVARGLESHVRQQPEDYLWLSRRWRTPVDGEAFVSGDGTHVRHAAFGSDRDPADPASDALESGASRSAGQGDRT